MSACPAYFTALFFSEAMPVEIDSHDAFVLRFKTERQQITKKGYTDIVESGEYFAPPGSNFFFDANSNKLYVTGGGDTKNLF